MPQELTSVKNGKITWKEYGADVRILKGELKGLMELRDDKLNKYTDQLDKFTEAFTDEFNAIHEKGYNLDGETGIKFFEYKDGILSVNPDIVKNPSKIAAAQEQNGIPSDNRIALELAGFRNKIISIDGRSCTIGILRCSCFKDGVDSRRLPERLTVRLSW